jgi:heme-degrading monooxygenase HmoA
VKRGREAAFEKRWADRESRLGTLDGFRYFCIMRRVDDDDAADDVSKHTSKHTSTQAHKHATRIL